MLWVGDRIALKKLPMVAYLVLPEKWDGQVAFNSYNYESFEASGINCFGLSVEALEMI